MLATAEKVFLPLFVEGEFHYGFRGGSKLRENLLELQRFIEKPSVEVWLSSLVSQGPGFKTSFRTIVGAALRRDPTQQPRSNRGVKPLYNLKQSRRKAAPTT